MLGIGKLRSLILALIRAAALMRALWQALVNDRRFAARGFKRQTPIGAHICDFVSFQLRTVIDLVPAAEEKPAAEQRAKKRTWLAARDYKIVAVFATDVESDLPALLERIDKAIG